MVNHPCRVPPRTKAAQDTSPQPLAGGQHGQKWRTRPAVFFAIPLLLCPLFSAASVVTSSPSTGVVNSGSPFGILNSVLGTGANPSQGGNPTSPTKSTAAETPAQKAVIRAEEARLAALQAERDQKIAEEQRQAHESLNGMGGRYFLPPLPGPAYVRPMVNTQYQEEFPLSPREIQWVKHQMQDDQYAIHKGAPLNIENPSLPVSLGPGAQVPTIRLAPGYVTTISIIGESGSPWPITSRQVGGGLSFDVSAVSQDAGAPSEQNVQRTTATATRNSAAVQSAKHSRTVHPQPVKLPSNLLTISPKYFGSSSNLVLTLKGVSTPVMVNVVADGPHSKTVDGMVTLRVDRHGPDATPPLYVPPPPSAVNPDLMQFLAQTPPRGAKILRVSGGFGVRAWTWNHRIIVRTRIPLLSPAWTAEVRQDGVMVYDLPKTRILMLRDDMSAAGGSWQMRTVLLSRSGTLDAVSSSANASQP